ncbi:hypothetical protein HELRODRAFT_72968 [Helobdella robusta]|uniref:Palmitoyltransferase n=1 Tax=Helobdella robusta TaxID=6412 RepID=T1G180_HELRO|nr:hypothetical protein HELRODRAFT_72968 [Helobdella robusta]ESO10142.1 hypothetical protein HELRODRAFT_72968 [Helobdella robusta]
MEGVKNYRSTSRVNGWSWPPHPLQIILWITIIYFIVFYYCTCLPALVSNLQTLNYILTLIMLIHIIFHLMASSINPADENVLIKFNLGSYVVAPFDRKIHNHVIENCRCNICGVDVLVVVFCCNGNISNYLLKNFVSLG